MLSQLSYPPKVSQRPVQVPSRSNAVKGLSMQKTKRTPLDPPMGCARAHRSVFGRARQGCWHRIIEPGGLFGNAMKQNPSLCGLEGDRKHLIDV